MAVKILMPALSPTMTEGNLAKWHKKEGDKIKPGDVIAEIETDKAMMEVEAADSGILAKILVAGGTPAVKVNEIIAVLKESGDDDSAVEALLAQNTNVAESVVEEKIANNNSVKVIDTSKALDNNRIFASPLAKRVASIESIDLKNVIGTGPKGRIVKDDVLNAKKNSIQSCSFGVDTSFRNQTAYNIVPHSQMRKVIAKRLTESKSLVPHFYLSADIDITNLSQARDIMNSKSGDRYRISINDFFVKAVAIAMKNNPSINSSWSEDGMIMYNNIDISIAVATDEGLITPIIKNADKKQLIEISNEVKALARKAKDNVLRPEEFQGGGFTISNLGMYGVKHFQAIINPPQSSILAIGVSEDRVVVKDGEMQVAKIVALSISCDHRVVDGAVAAMFMKDLKDILENPILLTL